MCDSLNWEVRASAATLECIAQIKKERRIQREDFGDWDLEQIIRDTILELAKPLIAESQRLRLGSSIKYTSPEQFARDIITQAIKDNLVVVSDNMNHSDPQCWSSGDLVGVANLIRDVIK